LGNDLAGEKENESANREAGAKTRLEKAFSVCHLHCNRGLRQDSGVGFL
jgi:hypothetical protein